jgi:hypothetical protein
MFRFSVFVIMLSTAALMGCSESVVKNQSSSALLQVDVDLMIHKAKSEERARVQAEYAKQASAAKVFDHLKKMSLPELSGNCLARVMVPAQRLSSDPTVQISKQRISYRVVVCKAHHTFENILKLQASLRDKGFLSLEGDNVDKINTTDDVRGGLEWSLG